MAKCKKRDLAASASIYTWNLQFLHALKNHRHILAHGLCQSNIRDKQL